jgi:phosphoribosyl 1,2-cyclic phosphodiesterase
VKVRFLGTRGEIEAHTPRHGRHSVLHVSHGGRALLVDCGRDWLGRLPRLNVQALLLTHAHPDHAGGLRNGAHWTVYATEETWKALPRYPLERRMIRSRQPERIAGMTVEAFPVEHSLRAPAVGYRIAGGRSVVFYAPDLVAVGELAAAFAGLDLYIGDGAAVGRSIIRYREGKPIGHASIRLQLDWCKEHGVRRAIFTHCGSELVRDARGAATRVEAFGAERGVRASLAHDGLEVVLRGKA